VFAKYLEREVTPELAGRYGFRPADETQKPAGNVTAANGVDPAQPARVLRLPEPRVLARIKEAWHDDRKPANVMVVLDNSGSMGEEGKLTHAKQGLKAFLQQPGPNDRIGLMKFSNQATVLVPIAPMKTNRKRIENAIEDILPEEDTRLRDTIVDAVDAVDAKLDRNAINAVVVLTDGADTTSDRSVEETAAELAKQGQRESGQIRVFTIAYGSEPNEVELGRYAQESGGKAFIASTQNIETVYQQISSFF
jgi:Ca-activated chloride channel homolog